MVSHYNWIGVTADISTMASLGHRTPQSCCTPDNRVKLCVRVAMSSSSNKCLHTSKKPKDGRGFSKKEGGGAFYFSFQDGCHSI